MTRSNRLLAAAVVLKGIVAREGDPKLAELLSAKSRVLPRYQALFAPDRLKNLSEIEFREFLYFRNNGHWASLQRLGPAICKDMRRLRSALAILLDEGRSVRERLDDLVPPGGAPMIARFNKAVITPILLIAQPTRYGVWNQVSEGALKRLELWPEFDRKDSFGARYERVNGLLLELASAVGVDLWTLDALFWRVPEPGQEGEPGTETAEAPTEDPAQFGLERHLHEFLRDNWTRTPLGKQWAILADAGDDEAGYEYPCGIGRIDILARHRTEPRWLVVELKRDQSSDQTVGQVLRYMGWVRKHVAKNGETVEGLVIARRAEDTLLYALDASHGVQLQLYEVDFRLKDHRR